MGYDFPSNPTNGQAANGYTWNGYAWMAPPSTGGSGNAGMAIADAPPLNPAQGQTWWESDTGSYYIHYDDGTSAQWVQLNVGANSQTDLVATGATTMRTAADRAGAFLTPFDFGAKADAKWGQYTVSIASGSAALSVSGAAPFAASDVGKMISVRGAGASGGVLTTTIASYISAAQITLAATAGTALSASLQIIAWGTNDQPALQALFDSGRRANVTAGTYGIASRLTLSNVGGSSQIEGGGRDTAIILALCPMPEMLYKNGFTGYPRVSGLTFQGARLVTHNINLYKAHGALITDCRVLNAVTGGSNIIIGEPGKAQQSYEIALRGNHVRNDPPLYTNLADLPLYNLEVYWSDNTFDHNVYVNAATANLYAAVGGNFFTDEHPFGYPAAFVGPTNFWSGGANSFLGCHADTSTGKAFYLDASANGSRVIGCVVQWLPEALPEGFATGQGIVLGTGVRSVSVIGNTFKTNGLPVPAVNLIVQEGTAHASTIVANNPDAAYATVPKRGAGLSSLQYGDGAAAPGDYAFALGQDVTASGQRSHVRGRNATDRGTIGSDVFSAAGTTVTGGEYQRRVTFPTAKTTSTNPARLWCNNALGSALSGAQSTALPDHSIFLSEMYVIGIQTTGDEYVAWKLATPALFARGTGAATILLINAPTWTKIGNSSGAASAAIAALTTDTMLGSPDITVTPPNTNTWKWFGYVHSLEAMR